MRSTKALLRSIAPEWVLRRRTYNYYAAMAERNRERQLAEIFTEIYARGAWSGGDRTQYVSGAGSLPENTKGYESFIADVICRDPKLETWVDIGCGDFQVAKRILDRLPRRVRYIGFDIAPNVIEFNARNFAAPNIAFHVLDICVDQPPSGDLVTVRQVLQHLSNSAISAALANLRAVFREAIITEGIIQACTPNANIVSGSATRSVVSSAVFVDEPPFSLQILEEANFPCTTREVLRTTRVALSRIHQSPSKHQASSGPLG